MAAMKTAATMHKASSSTEEMLSDLSTDHDETEQKLEKLVFGDNAGFLRNLKNHRGTDHLLSSNDASSNVETPAKDSDDNDLEGVRDSDLFFLDSGPTAVDVPHILPTHGSESVVSDPEDRLAWIDSDDERRIVSLASNPQLRKLRNTESEDLVNGKEYTKRLQRQFERLYPVPDWANPSAANNVVEQKKRRPSNMSDNAEQSSTDDDGMSVGSDDMSTQPLAKLLQMTNLTHPEYSASGTRRKLRPDVIDVHRLKDVGGAQPSAITGLAFHPLHPLIHTSGPSALISLFHISPNTPNPNPLLTNLHLRHTPLSSSHFLPPKGNKIFFSGRRRYFHIWDLETAKVEKVSKIFGHREEQKSMERFKLSPCGRWMGLVGSPRKGGGYINVIDTKSSQWVAEVRVEGNGGVADFDWWGDGDGLVVFGKGGEAVEYSMDGKRVIARWIDEGAVGTTVVALGGRSAGPEALGGDRWLAVGSSCGIVNIYDRRGWKNADSVPARPKPTRALDQLTTPTSHLAFSPDGQVLCMGSRWKNNALRLVHLPSCAVFKNWPTGATPLGRITAVGWSANSEMLGVGNEQGKLRLFEVRG